MVYKTWSHPTCRLAAPCRLGAEIANLVESLGPRCTHYDAFRFFAPDARPLNKFQPTRETTITLEQPACLHANMDLYKWAFKLSPFTASELIADCFDLARELRVLDMRASPYDFTVLGHRPIPIEAPEGRLEYEALQRQFAVRAAPLRERLVVSCEQVLAQASLPKNRCNQSAPPNLVAAMTIADDIHTWAEIDLSAIRHNVDVVRKRIGARAGIIAIVKANAYGHGASMVAGAIADLVELFGVASVEEAEELSSLKRDVLLLSPSAPVERRELVERRYIATVSSAAEAACFSGGRINFKVDTGMGRIGCSEENALRELRMILRLKNVEVHSVSTHLPVSDEDVDFTLAQLGRFAELVEAFRPLVPAAKFTFLTVPEFLSFLITRTIWCVPGSCFTAAPTRRASSLSCFLP